MTVPIPHFDGHNDFLLRLLRNPESRATTWLDGNGKGHLICLVCKGRDFGGGYSRFTSPHPQRMTTLISKP